MSKSKHERQVSQERELRRAQIFLSESSESIKSYSIRPARLLAENSSVQVLESKPDYVEHEEDLTEPVSKGSKGKWFFFFAIAVLGASVVEFTLFVKLLIEQMDWLAGIWLILFGAMGVFISKIAFEEWNGLRELKRQQRRRDVSKNMFETPAIGLAEKHCSKIASNLPNNYQPLVTKWRGSFDSHHTDNEILCLFEQLVLVPLDKVAVKHLSKNASAAGVMIAVSPFALLDMLIVLWRNIRVMNQISHIYGVKLGYWGRIGLIRKVFHTMLYAGAGEILSDAGNYALGSSITSKLSTRVAQGMGVGVLTARIGVKAIKECRPMPFLSVSQPGVSEITKQLLDDINTHLK